MKIGIHLMLDFDVGQATRTYEGESICGDVVVCARTDDALTIALADGLGHGAAAAEPAQIFCTYVQAHAQQSLPHLLDGAAAALRGTRGAAVGVLRLTQQLEFAGIGNIQVQARSRYPISAISVPGILGYRKTQVRVHCSRIEVGDVIAMYSDGVGDYALRAYAHMQAMDAAHAIVLAHGKPDDDVSCVVVRCQEIR